MIYTHIVFFPVISSNHTWTSEKITVPDGVISLRAVALVMSDNLGLGFTPMPQKVTNYSPLHASDICISYISCLFLLQRGYCAFCVCTEKGEWEVIFAFDFQAFLFIV